MSEGEESQPLPESKRGFSNLRALGIVVLSILLYMLLLDAAVETFVSDSPVKWWVVGAVATYLGLSGLLWRRSGWGTKAALSLFVLLGLFVFAAWWPEGLTRGVVLVRQPTSTVLSAVTALAILLAGIGLMRLKFIPIWGGVAIALLALYGVAAFGMGVKMEIPYPDLFRGRSFWEWLPFWLRGVFAGTFIVSAAIVVQLIYGLLKVRGQELRTWGVQMLALSLGLAIAAAGLREPLGLGSTPMFSTSRPTPVPQGPQVAIQAIALDETGTKPTSMVPNDAPTIYVRWRVEGITKKVELQGRWIAAEVEGLQPDAALSTPAQAVDRNASGFFSFTRPASGWKPGRYRAEISVAGGALQIAEFVIAAPRDAGEKLDVVLAKGVTEADKPISPTTEFPDNIETIYAVLTSIPPDGSVRAQWIAARAEGYGANTRLAESVVAGSTTVGGRQGAKGIVLWLQAPQGGFPPGDYQVNIHYRSDKSGEVSRAFKVVPVPILPPPPPLIASQPGVVSRYFADHSYNSLKKSDVVQGFTLDWGSPPVVPVDGKRFWIEWEGVLSVPGKGRYEFKIEGDGNGFLYLDGKRVIRERKRENDPTPLAGSMELDAGKHTIRLAAIQDQTQGKFALKWKKEGDQDYASIDPRYLGHTDDQRKWSRGPRQAAQVGIEWLQSDSIDWQRQHRCFGCHVQGQVIMGLSVAAQNNYRISEEYFKELVRFTKKVQNPQTGTYHSGHHNTATQFAAMALSFFDVLTKAKQNSTLLKSANWLNTNQKPDGEIPIDHIEGPIDQGSIMTTANSVTAFMQAFQETREARYKEAADRSLAWISATTHETTQDKALKVIALARYGTPEQKQLADKIIEQLKTEQLTDGGWKETPRMQGSNSYATGQVLCAFKEARVSVNSMEFRRGVRFLLKTQKITAAWPARVNTQSHRPSEFALTMWPVICLAGAFENIEFVPDGILQVVSDIQRSKKPTKNLVIILDSSGSMNRQLGKTTRWGEALEVFKEAVEKLPDDFNVGVRVYAHRYPSGSRQTCTDTELVVPVRKLDRGRILSAIGRLKPRGDTPLVYSVLQTISDLKGVGGGSVVLITDGEETCRGDPVVAAQQLKDSGIDITLHIVGFTIKGKKVEQQLTAFAETTGGRYFSAQSGKELARALLIAAVDKLPYTIFDAAGKQVGKGETGDPREELPPGKYKVVVQAVDQELVAENVSIASNKETMLKVVLKEDRFVLKEGEKELASVSLQPTARPSGEEKSGIESGAQRPKKLKSDQPAEKAEKPVLPSKKEASLPRQEEAKVKQAASKKEATKPIASTKSGVSESRVEEKQAKKEVPKEQPAPARLGVYMAITRAPVRGQPQSEADTVSYLETGMRVRVVGQVGDYLEVRSTSGRPPGYILRKDVVFVQSE